MEGASVRISVDATVVTLGSRVTSETESLSSDKNQPASATKMSIITRIASVFLFILSNPFKQLFIKLLKLYHKTTICASKNLLGVTNG